ncbi:MAG: hypothetical protein ACREYE_08690 [Gammaproteobacteria bacterium]
MGCGATGGVCGSFGGIQSGPHYNYGLLLLQQVGQIAEAECALRATVRTMPSVSVRPEAWLMMASRGFSGRAFVASQP